MIFVICRLFGGSHFNRFDVISHCFFLIFFFLEIFFFYLFIFCFFFISLAAPAACGGSQARGRIGAVATGLLQSHSNAGSEPSLQPTAQLTATPDP